MSGSDDSIKCKPRTLFSILKLTENRRAIRGICDNLWVKIALENIIKLICKESGIQGGKVNNSARNSTFATGEHAGNLTTLVQQHSSHKKHFFD